MVRGHIDTDAGLTDVIPVQGMRSSPHLEFAGNIRAATGFPTFHAAKIQDVTTARYAIAAGKLDHGGHDRAPTWPTRTSCARCCKGARTASAPAWGPTFAWTAFTRAAEAYCLHNPATGRELTMPHTIPKAAQVRRVLVVGAGPGGHGSGTGCR